MPTHTNLNDAALDTTTGLPVYGMDLDVAEKTQQKWESADKMQQDARAWIEAVLGEQLDRNLHDALKSGVVLCNLVNAIKPGICPRPSPMAAPFQRMENIGNYVRACEKLGVRKEDSFQTVALYEKRDMIAVLRQIHQFGAVAQAIGYDGPKLGAKLAQGEQGKREFTKPYVGLGVMGSGSKGHAALVIGADGLASQTGMGRFKEIVQSGEAPLASGELSLMGTGSKGHAAAVVGADGLASQAGMGRFKEIVQPVDAPMDESMTIISQGSLGCASQAGMVDRSREIVRTVQLQA